MSDPLQKLVLHTVLSESGIEDGGRAFIAEFDDEHGPFVVQLRSALHDLVVDHPHFDTTRDVFSGLFGRADGHIITYTVTIERVG